MNFIHLLLVICVTSSFVDLHTEARNVGRNGGQCQANSFRIKPNLLSDSGSDTIYVFNVKADVIISLPVGFENNQEYVNSCLDKRIFKLIKTDAPSTVINSKSLEKSDQSNSLNFENLEYLTNYEVQSFYTQVSPSKMEVESEKTQIRTCFGEPGKVNNLKIDSYENNKLKITWTQPTMIRANKICYYEIKISKDKSPSESSTYTVKGDVTEFITTGKEDIKFGWRVYVSAINDKSYQSSACYTGVDNCSKKGSGVEEIVWEPKPTTTKPVITTPKSGAGSVYQLVGCRFFISFFSIFIYFLRLY